MFPNDWQASCGVQQLLQQGEHAPHPALPPLQQQWLQVLLVLLLPRACVHHDVNYDEADHHNNVNNNNNNNGKQPQ
jgi:hypothetical protein